MAFFLRTFGPIELVTAAGHKVPGAGMQPKPLLILALAALTPGGISRDRLLKAMWPGIDRERARASLKQHLYALRRATGMADIVSGAGRITVPVGTLRVDALEFNDLVDAGRLVEASRLLRGELLFDVGIEGRHGGELDRIVADLRERWARRTALVRSHAPLPDAPADRADGTPLPRGPHLLVHERELRAAARRFVHGLITLPGDDIAAAHRVIWCMHDLLEAVTAAAGAGLPDPRIADSIVEARELWERSDILRQCRDEGRGLSVAEEEWLVDGAPRSADPIGHALEQYLLRSSCAGEMRALHAWQTLALCRVLGGPSAPQGARLLVLGGISSRVLAEEAPSFHRPIDRLVYAPDDDAASAVASLRLDELGARFLGIEGDRITGLTAIAAEAPFDLMLCGGVLDAMTTRSAAWLIERLVTMLAPGGRLLLAAQRSGSTLASWRQHILGWSSGTRERDELLALLGDRPGIEVECSPSPGGEQWLLVATREAIAQVR